MGIITSSLIREGQGETGINSFSATPELVAFISAQKLTTSSLQEVSLDFKIGAGSFRLTLQGSFSSASAGDQFSEFLSRNQDSIITKRLTFLNGSPYQEESFQGSKKISELFNVDMAKVYSGDDTFAGSFLMKDYVNGYSGNDTMSGFGATPTNLDVFFGGDGIDTAVFPSKAADYVVRSSNSVYDPKRNKSDLQGYNVVNKANSAYGKADLYQVERIQFSDSSIALDSAGNAGQAYRVYKAAFNRDPMLGDRAGLGYWIAQIDKGMDLLEVAARFVDSKEFRDLYGTSPTNAQFLNKLYENVLGRPPETTGYNWWLNELNTNPSKTKAKALADFAESSENQAGVASLIGNGIAYEPWVGP